jgi:hypothetical protein
MDQRQSNPKLAGGGVSAIEGAWDMVKINVASGNQAYDRLGRGFHIDTDGNLAFTTEKGSDVLLLVKAGMYYPYCSQKVLQTGTTCTGFIIF